MSVYTNLNKQFINGKWVDGTEELILENFNPYNNEHLHRLSSAGKKEVDAAFHAAKQASKDWANTNPLVRRNLLLRAAELIMLRKEEYIDWLTKETGSTYLKSVIEIQQAHDVLIEASSFPTRMHGLTLNSTIDDKESYVFRRPLGVVSLISPWNFPLYLSMRAIAPALATGNTMVVKPSASSFVTGGTFIAKLLEEAGFPVGVFNVVIGSSDLIGDYFTGHADSKLVLFTGSSSVGRNIGKITGGLFKKFVLELGGNNVFIVLEDANLDNAAKAAVFGKFLHQGQLCISVNRILIHKNIFEKFKGAFVEKVRQLNCGDPQNRENVVGPLINASAVKRIQHLIKESLEMGASVETGNLTVGNLMQPTVLSGVTSEMPVFKEEIFGPVVGLISFENDEEAVHLANATAYGLSGALFTGDIYRGMKLARQIETGMFHINDQTASDEVHTPFGGEKNSGTGRFGGEFIMNELTTVQWVSVQKEPRKYPF